MFEGGETAYNNWIEFAVGGFVTHGNKGQFQQQNQYPAGAFGGISDFHFQTNIAKGTTLTLDGRGIVNNHDYNVSVGVQREKFGYLKFSASEYRTWYNGDGGYWPPTASYYPLRNNELGLDRGDLSVEAGLTLDKVPQMKFKYEHTTREGAKSLTIWGDTHPGAGQGVRGLSPSVYDIDEKADIFSFDLTHTIKKVDVGAGFRYETSKLNDSLKIDQFPGESIDQKVTDKQGTSYDMFNVHSFAESWVKKNVLVSAGFAFNDLDNNFSGSRNYGADYDVSYTPNAQNGLGYYGLTGGSHLNEYVGNVNLFTTPWRNFSIVPSVRIQQQSTDANSSGTETLGAFAPVPFSGNSDLASML